MSASSLPSVRPNRRRRVRHKVRTPAYATFPGESNGAVLDLHEIADLSEEGLSIECHTSLNVGRRIRLCLDLAGSGGHIYAAGQVIWTNAFGRAGLCFSDLSPGSLSQLREWLFLNAMTGLTIAEEAGLAALSAVVQAPPPSYSDVLAAVTAVQREVEALGSDLAGAVQLIVSRTQALLRASGAALALSDEAPGFMVCRASAGPDAPPVGARLQVEYGFSGECVKTGSLLRCDDTETDSRVDPESCRALGIRSILAAPVRAADKSIGILEVFSPQPGYFKNGDSNVLLRLAETVVAAVNRTARARNLPLPGEPWPVAFDPTPGSVLFASAPKEKEEEKKEEVIEEKSSGGITLPRSHLIILICVAAVISTVLGDYMAPWIQSKLRERGQIRLQTVLASSLAPKPTNSIRAAADPPVETATLPQLRQMAENGNAAAENALGLRYFQGDEKSGIPQDEQEAFRWFSRAAEDGSLKAQSKLGSLYWSGRGVAKDLNKAYFWSVLARARGDQGSKELAQLLAGGMTRSRQAAIEQEADIWLQQHPALVKPGAGR
jgi:GAF domain-containing protein/PilZ domain-containing protein/Sel1 repeat-containing protein